MVVVVLQSKPLDAIDLLDDIASRAGSAVDTMADGGGGRTEALLNLDGNLAALVAEQYAADGTTLGLSVGLSVETVQKSTPECNQTVWSPKCKCR